MISLWEISSNAKISKIWNVSGSTYFQKPNLQKVTVDGKSVRMSAREIRTLNKASKKAKETEEA